MLAFQIQGWELVVSGVDERQAALLKESAVRVTGVGEGRYTAELQLEPSPDRLIARLAAAGARLVSINPIRQTLEDFFVEQVSSPEAQTVDRLESSTAGGRS
jgi:hypothetical protein